MTGPPCSTFPPIVRCLRGVSAALLCAAAGPSCLLEFPERQFEAADAGATDSGSDLGTIAQDRFEWAAFVAHGLVAGPTGELHPLYFKGRTGEDRRLTFEQLQLGESIFDGSTEIAPPQAPQAIGNGAFRLRMPDVGPLVGASVVLTRDDASGLGSVRLEGAPGWGGAIVLTRLGAAVERPGEVGPFETRLVSVGAGDDGSARAAFGFGAFGSADFSYLVGRKQDGTDFAPAVGLGVSMAETGIFSVSDVDWGMCGAWLRELPFFIAHGCQGARGRLPEIRFGMPNDSQALGLSELAGRWLLNGVQAGPDGWEGVEAVLEVGPVNAPDVPTELFSLRADAVGLDQRGDIKWPVDDALPFPVVAFDPVGDAGTRWFATGSTELPVLLLWGMDGRNPAPRLLFGLREN
jgi:hypothetical protein